MRSRMNVQTMAHSRRRPQWASARVRPPLSAPCHCFLPRVALLRSIEAVLHQLLDHYSLTANLPSRAVPGTPKSIHTMWSTRRWRPPTFNFSRNSLSHVCGPTVSLCTASAMSDRLTFCSALSAYYIVSGENRHHRISHYCFESSACWNASLVAKLLCFKDVSSLACIFVCSVK